ncbi:MAG: response regulator transcription factor [Dehalococcoides mccartyi]|uniref:response regulator transcription factor n=1 Tax=Dehalococcoides mccartyi TaxID=61435 RepID=UPI0004E0790F|nr:response regulator transcription factor [Dehalococcoides mccartyi]AII59010.1 chemotaxis protein CheY [Dehalococcoides mccartyi CG4]
MKIVIIEDDEDIVKILKLTFQIRWPSAEILSATYGSKGVLIVESQSPDLVILDLGLPDIDGFEVLDQIRSFSSEVPVLILTVSNDEPCIVRALESGADEYIIKPFHQLELLSRVKVLLRRRLIDTDEIAINVGPFKLSKYSNALIIDKRRLLLTNTEKIIMSHLLANVGNLVPTVLLAEAIWGNNYSTAKDAVRVHVWRLRHKIESDPQKPKFILTIPRQGFKLSIN